ncbi:germ cell-specific gene 1 protein-like isoform X2 [Megalobrama amblycephala]|uniref:germ cell-specific gene 1 protein-like isoform X2 n=1 Tax=Megalobrama amblycephala TaxID=75352 RepID=UPI0020141A5A|nr:germ cell-specific gene 1 protein-like isoform X2 [Megalobrama amblycephala]
MHVSHLKEGAPVLALISMSVLSLLRSPRLSFLQTLLALLLSLLSLSSSHWCVGRQKMPKPLCSPVRRLKCTPVPGMTDGSFSWETGDDRFIFPSFHAGLWTVCDENIYTDAWEEKCRSFMALTPAAEKGMVWLYVGMELLYVGLLCVSSLLLLLQLCLSSWCPPQQRCAHLLNAFAAVCTVLAGLVGMVAHMMYMQVFQVTISNGPEDFRPHSYGYSWAFYVAWVAFSCCMSSGVLTLNNYTKKFMMLGPKNRSVFYPCRNFTFPPQPPSLSPLSPYFGPPLPPPPACPAPRSPCPALARHTPPLSYNTLPIVHLAPPLSHHAPPLARHTRPSLTTPCPSFTMPRPSPAMPRPSFTLPHPSITTPSPFSPAPPLYYNALPIFHLAPPLYYNALPIYHLAPPLSGHAPPLSRRLSVRTRSSARSDLFIYPYILCFCFYVLNIL